MCHFNSLCRNRVSTSLASDFCNKMNWLILSFIQRRDRYFLYKKFAETNRDHPFCPQSVVYQSANPVESVSLLVVHYIITTCKTKKIGRMLHSHQSSQNVVSCLYIFMLLFPEVHMT